MDIILPMLADKGGKPFDDAGYAFEFKFDGVRMLWQNSGGEPLLYNRKGTARTAQYPEAVSALLRLPAGIVLDGEMIALDKEGRQNFYAVLRRDLASGYRPDKDFSVAYAVFDILFFEGKSVMDLSYIGRREILESVLTPLNGAVRLVDSFAGIGSDLFSIASSEGLEGVVAKKLTSKYLPETRSKEWLKIKCRRKIDVLIGGFLIKSRPSVCLGIPGKEGLRFVGCAGTGLSAAAMDALVAALTEMRISTNPFTGALPKGAVFTRPQIGVRVGYMETEPDGKLRQPVIESIL